VKDGSSIEREGQTMSQTIEAPPKFRTVAELLHELGDIPPERVRLRPNPGEATENDLLKPDGRLCELIDGTLVEKAMGYDESLLAVELLLTLAAFVKRHRLGEVTAPDGTMRLMPGLVLIPDLAFIARKNLPKKAEPRMPIPDLVPDLAVEVLSMSNTKAEMKRKLREYFGAGVRLVWLIDPETRTVLVHTSPEASTKLGKGQTLDGGDVLPGFALPLAELFECLDRRDD
jgi:Uma2 family endonuclease